MKSTDSLRMLYITALAPIALLLGAPLLPAAEGPKMNSYYGDMARTPCQLFLAWTKSDDVTGFLTTLDGKNLTFRLSGENYRQGFITLKASLGYGDAGIIELKKEPSRTSGTGDQLLKQGFDADFVWNGTFTFKNGIKSPVTFIRGNPPKSYTWFSRG